MKPTGYGETLASDDPLLSWNDTGPKKAVVEFLERVTKEGSPDFVKPEDRIATFDNDGTLWVEQPNYTQVTFAIDEWFLWRHSIQNGATWNPSSQSLGTIARR